MFKIGLYSESEIEKIQKFIRVSRTNSLAELQTCKVILVDGLIRLQELLDNNIKIPLIVLLENYSDLNRVNALKHEPLIFYRFKNDPIDTLKETIFLLDKIIKE